MAFIYVFLGGGIGALLRYFCYLLLPAGMVWATLLVNVTGSLAIGILAANNISEQMRLLCIVGILGGFTTFSAFSLDTIRLMQQGELLQMIIYIFASISFSAIAAFIGFYLSSIN